MQNRLNKKAVLQGVATLVATLTKVATMGVATVRAAFPADYRKFDGENPANSGSITILSGPPTPERLQSFVNAAPTARHWLIWLAADENGARTPQIRQVQDGMISNGPSRHHTTLLVMLP